MHHRSHQINRFVGRLVLLIVVTFSFTRHDDPNVPAPRQPRTEAPPVKVRQPLPTRPIEHRALRPSDRPDLAGTSEAIAEPAFDKFNAWRSKYQSSAGADRSQLEADGLKLAEQRRGKMLDLIQTDPQRALELEVTPERDGPMPDAIVALLEKRVSGRGTLGVLAGIPADEADLTTPILYRTAEIAGVQYRAFVYGRRLTQPTQGDVNIHGIALDGFLAVQDDPTPALGARVAAWGVEIDAPALEESPLVASSWTEGTKTVVLIRVDFSDLEGEPFPNSTGTNLMANLHSFYQEMSYRKAGFALMGEGSAMTPTFRMPQTAAYYGALDASRLRTDARAAARAAGYDLSQYDLDVVCFGAVPGFRFAGLAYVGAPGAWLRNSFGTGVAAHELGHNFGLNHANFWDTSGQSVIGSGTSVEYGDTFDTMGSANAGSKHFNARYKNLLNWLPNSNVIAVAESGTYVIAAHDDPSASGIRALRIAKNSRTNYWVEFRQHYLSNKWLMEGVSLRWAGNGSESTRLLDTTPGSPSAKDDAAILPGQTFSDARAGIHVTPLRKIGTNPESIEVRVELGSFPMNGQPTLELAGETNAAVNSVVTFSAAAFDPDGDALAYAWDFGDRTFGANQSQVQHSWAAAGEFVVRCVVSDGKGGRASAWRVVRIGSPNTFSLSGQILQFSKPVEGVRVYVSSTQMTYTGSDGRYVLPGLSAGSYNVRSSLDGYTFAHTGFFNPVSLGPSRAGIDFVAVTRDGQSTTSLVAAGAIWQYLDDGSVPGAAWRTLEFDDFSWNEGPAPLGYGDDTEKTSVRFGPDANAKYVTTYFRHRFVVDRPQVYSLLTLGLRRDDGGVVYLNGREVFRSNMPVGAISATTLASSTVGGADERAFVQTDLDPIVLRSGTNLMAVEVHQAARSSSDIVFDAELVAIEAPGANAPVLAWAFTETGLQVHWPDGPTPWKLQRSASLGALADWVTVDLPVQTVGDRKAVSVQFLDAQSFYRLGPP